MVSNDGGPCFITEVEHGGDDQRQVIGFETGLIVDRKTHFISVGCGIGFFRKVDKGCFEIGAQMNGLLVLS